MKWLLALTTVTLSACSSYAVDIPPLNVPDEPYVGKNCQELAVQLETVIARAETLRFGLDEEAEQDRFNAPAEILVFGTSWLMSQHLGKRKQREAEYARLKGERNAMRRVLATKRCIAETATPAAESASAVPQVPGVLPSAP